MSRAGTVERESAGTTRRDTAPGYRPHLDGLRTVAVYLVVAFHSGLSRFSGGFIGVDIFFVLSGFLVTRILLRHLGSGVGIQARTFYARRVRRILPAAIVTLIVSALVYSVIASPLEIVDVAGGFRAASLYVANWYFIHQATDYFAANVNNNPVLHFWSLAIEEQFYLLWPLVLGAAYMISGRLGRRRWWALRVAVIAMGVASALWALHLGRSNLERAYYGTDARAYQLLAGAALALTPQLLKLRVPQRSVPRVLAAFSVLALILLATSAIDVGPITRGLFAVVLTVTLIVSLENARGGRTKRLLSSDPFTYLGRISYGTYLWHWPIIVFIVHDHHPSPLALFSITVVVATLVAALSFRVLEHPIRTARTLNQFKTQTIALGLTASVLTGVVVLPVILRDRGSSTVAGFGGSSKYHLLDWRKARLDVPRAPDCLGKNLQQCIVVHGTKKRVMLIGDSHALMWLPAFEAIAREESWSLYVAAAPTCPWQRGMLFTFRVKDEPYCAKHWAAWYDRAIPKFDPDIVILDERAYDDPRQSFPVQFPDRHRTQLAHSDYEPRLIRTSTAGIRKLHDAGRKVVIIEPIPDTWPFLPLDCLSKGTPPAHCTYTPPTAPTPLEQEFRQLASQMTGVWSVDLDPVVCPRLPTCDTVVGDVIVYRDDGHVTATFARSQAETIRAIFAKEGILSGASYLPAG